MKRVTPARSAGVINPRAPFWSGITAETILEARRQQYEREAEEKRSRRRGAKTARAPHSPSRELSRLKRALTKRKTLEARIRVQQRIDQLELELG